MIINNKKRNKCQDLDRNIDNMKEKREEKQWELKLKAINGEGTRKTGKI